MERVEHIVDQIVNEYSASAIAEVLDWRGDKQQYLFERACRERTRYFDNFVELRSVIEVSNICRQQCLYCTMGRQGEIDPFMMNAETLYPIIENLILKMGRETILLQSGENGNQEFVDEMSDVCQRVMKHYPQTRLTLCFGNLTTEQYAQLRKAGADRYILKFESSNPELYHWYKNDRDTLDNRLEKLSALQELGFKIGTGNIVGLPKQTRNDLVNDLLLTRKFRLSMVSSTVFIPNERSAFAHEAKGDLEVTLNFLALLRILHPGCLIPTTSSLEKMQKNGQLRGLCAGCNTVTIHDGTPDSIKKQFPIYSDSRFSPKSVYCQELIERANMISKPALL